MSTELTRTSEKIEQVREAMETLKAVRTFIMQEMKEGVDFGTIPGTGDKKNMLLPGAQKVIMFFNSYPRYTVETTDLGNGHAEFRVATEIVSRDSGLVVGSGTGSCSTMEGKYRFRTAARVCPHCNAPAIIKGKKEYGGGWICWKNKKDTPGCGAKFLDGDPAIEGQIDGKVENENIHDQRNTVLKMAKKRSLVDAGIALGCLSDLFTQDLEDMGVYDMAEKAPEKAPEPPKNPSGTPQEARSEPTAAPANPLMPTINADTVKTFLAELQESAAKATDFVQLALLVNQYKSIAKKLGAEEDFLNIKVHEFLRLHEEADPLIPIPDGVPKELELEFYALDAVASRNGDVKTIFYALRPNLVEAGLDKAWKDYGTALKKEVEKLKKEGE